MKKLMNTERYTKLFDTEDQALEYIAANPTHKAVNSPVKLPGYSKINVEFDVWEECEVYYDQHSRRYKIVQ